MVGWMVSPQKRDPSGTYQRDRIQRKDLYQGSQGSWSLIVDVGGPEIQRLLLLKGGDRAFSPEEGKVMRWQRQKSELSSHEPCDPWRSQKLKR